MSKTTVAVDQELRKKIKKMSALLEITQSAVIEKAITNLERELILSKEKELNLPTSMKEETIDISKILADATQQIWKRDPERENIQKKLRKGSPSIDDFLMNDWITGLE